MLSRVLTILSLAVAFACSGCFLFPDSDDSPPIAQPLATEGAAEQDWALEVGQGEGTFAPMEDGAHVTKIHGSQGGYHVFVAARLDGPSVREDLMAAKRSASGYSYAYVEVEVDVGERIVSRSVSMIAATPAATDETSFEFPSLYAYLDADVRGDVTINVKVATEDKTKWASGTRHVFVDE
jgi:hypothetical protein